MFRLLITKLKKIISSIVVRCLGWKIEGKVPEHIPKVIMLGVPHTSNWDFFMMMCCAWQYGLNVKWLGKEGLFANRIMRFLSTMMGGIKVERGISEKAVEKIAFALRAETKRICLAIAPEGSRHKRQGWRSGFYYIAKQAQIPIALGYLDYGKRRMGVGPIISDLTDLESTMATIRQFYKDITGKFPHKQSPIQLV